MIDFGKTIRSVGCERRTLAKMRPTNPAALFEDDATRNGGLSLLVWGFGTVAAVVLGFASWQYAPPRPSEPETHVAANPAADEVTGSIAAGERAATASTAASTRVIGGSRFPAVATAPSEPAATQRDLAELRGEIRDLHRTIAQMGLSGDAVSRRLDRLEGRIDGLAQAAPPAPIASVETPPPPGPTVRSETVSTAPATALETAAAVRIPQPKPDADLPAVTGSVPAKAVAAPGKTDRETAPAAAPPATPPPPAEPARAANAAADATKVTTTTTSTATLPPSGGVAAIDLGGHRSLQALRKSWTDMSERYAEFGTGIEPLARLRETDTGMEVRLVAGPYPTPSDAAKTCTRMRALGVACAVTGYTGQPLAAIR